MTNSINRLQRGKITLPLNITDMINLNMINLNKLNNKMIFLFKELPIKNQV